VIDAWGGPPPTPQQFPKNEPNGIRALLDKIDRIALQAKESTSNLLRTAGIRVSPTGMFIDSSLTVDGSLDTTGDTTIGGALAVTGTLSLPAGIIGNAALTSPVMPQAVYFETQNFALSHTSASTFTSSTVTVPAGFTSAVVSVVGRLFAINPNAGADYLSAVTKIDGTGGVSVPLLVGPSGGSGINVSPFSRVLTGLTPGGTFVLALMGNSNIADWAADAANIAEVSGTILWFR
jgi:hypothetical protein